MVPNMWKSPTMVSGVLLNFRGKGFVVLAIGPLAVSSPPSVAIVFGGPSDIVGDLFPVLEKPDMEHGRGGYHLPLVKRL